MANLFFDTMDRLSPNLRAGDLSSCEREVVELLESLPPSPFHIATSLSIGNDPADAARHFDMFLAREQTRFPIAAAYTEMNGFDINPDRWYCDLFAYSRYGGHEDYNWISDWQSAPFDDFQINGLEKLQAVYADKKSLKPEHRNAGNITSLLVVVKFQRFMVCATEQMTELNFPLLSTAHDFDFIAEHAPNSQRSV